MNWKETRKRVLERDNGLCIRCGDNASDVHHRKLKGMGGSKLLDTPANLISICRRCHDWIHRNPTYAVNLGYIVKSGFDPEQISMITQFGLLSLRDDGSLDLRDTYDKPPYLHN